VRERNCEGENGRKKGEWKLEIGKLEIGNWEIIDRHKTVRF
jgi:hypothetical protein